MIRVLGIDLGNSSWANNGSALLGFEPGANHFFEVKTPAIAWPARRLTAAAMADAVDGFVREMGIVAVALDGPQGWRDPETAPGTPGVGRRCEYECRTQAKTGVYPQTYPSNQRPWVQFCVDVFASLLATSGVRLATIDACGAPPADDYVVLECFPTSAWRTSGLAPLPSKARRPDLRPFAESLVSTFHLPSSLPNVVQSHDDLQAVVASLAAAAYVGGPVGSKPRGAPAATRTVGGVVVPVEGLIWDIRPLESPAVIDDPSVHDDPAAHSSEAGTPRVRVTQHVLDQVARAGRSQAQIALGGFRPGPLATGSPFWWSWATRSIH